MNKRNKLACKYFMEQKTHEIEKSIVFLFVIGLIGLFLFYIPTLIGENIGDNKSKWCGEEGTGFDMEHDCTPMQTWFEGFIYLILIVIVFTLFYIWIMDNWDEAQRKAEIEVRNIKKGRKKK